MLIPNASWIRMKDAVSTIVPIFRKQFETSKKIVTFATSLHKSEDYEEDLSGLCGLCCTLCL